MVLGDHELPVLHASHSLLFPGGRLPFVPRSHEQLEALIAAVDSDVAPVAALLAIRDTDSGDVRPDSLHDVGTTVRVVQFGRQRCCRRWIAELEAVDRVRVIAYPRLEPFMIARCIQLVDRPEDEAMLHALGSAITNIATQMNARFPDCMHTQRALARLREVRLPHEIGGAVSSLLLHVPIADLQRVLETEPLSARLEAVVGHLHAFQAHDLGRLVFMN